MLNKFKLVFFIVIALSTLVLVNYSSPTYRIGKITGAEVKRVDASNEGSEDDKSTKHLTRDVYYAYLQEDSGEPYVLRNEDTGLGFPLYFKFDSANEQAKIRGFQDDKSRVLVKYYGWRVTILSIFPNLLDVKKTTDMEAPFSITAIIMYSIWFLLFVTLYIFLFKRKKQNN